MNDKCLIPIHVILISSDNADSLYSTQVHTIMKSDDLNCHKSIINHTTYSPCYFNWRIISAVYSEHFADPPKSAVVFFPSLIVLKTAFSMFLA